MRICVLGNLSRTVYIFWRVLMEEMRARGHEVVAMAPGGDPENDARLEAMGVPVRHYRLNRKGVNPMDDLQTFLDLEYLFKAERPDVVFATTIKPVIYGCMAAFKARVPHVYATITGLGYAFERDTFPKKIVHAISVNLYRNAIHDIDGIFFQNRDDERLFRKCNIVDERSRVLFARGTGVDTGRFSPQPLPEERGPVFLVVARLLEAKGLRDFAQAAKIVKGKVPTAKFRILGPAESGPGSVSVDEVRSWPEVEYLGETDDVVPFVRDCHVVVLPSWREGTPTSVMEAMSMERACLVTDVPGCREVVAEGVNGLLVPAKDPRSLAAAMERLAKDPEMVRRMGAAGRERALAEFDARVVANGILDDMRIPRLAPPEPEDAGGRSDE